MRSMRAMQRELTDLHALTRIGTWRRKTNSEIPEWSDQTYLLHGLPIGMPITRSSVSQLILEEDRERVIAAYDEGVEQKKAFRVVFRIVRPDGEIRVLHADNQVSEDPETGNVTIHGAVQDITNPTHGTDRLSLISGLFPADSLVINLDGVVVRGNGIMRSRLPDAGPSGSVFQLFSPGESHDILKSAMDRIASGAGPQSFRLVSDTDVSPGGELYGLGPWKVNDLLSGFILTPSSHVPLSHVAENGNGSEAPGRLAAGAWEIEIETKQAIWSEGMYEIMGLSQEDEPLSIEAFRNVVHPDDLDNYLDQVHHFYETHEPISFRFRLVALDGRIKNVQLRMETVSRTSPHSHAFGTLTDVSQHDELYGVTRRQGLRMKSMQDSLEQMNLRLLDANLRLTKAQEEERNRISIDLHDRAGGLITSLNLVLHLVENEGLRDHVTSARNMLDELGELIRQTSRQLRPDVLNRFGIEAAIRQLSEDTASLASISLSMDTQPLDILPESRIATGIFRIAREAMMNVVRHAQATSLKVELGLMSNHVRLKVSDNGCGFDLEEALSRSTLGLTTMFDRADSVGGSIHISSPPEGGTSLELFVPID